MSETISPSSFRALEYNYYNSGSQQPYHVETTGSPSITAVLSTWMGDRLVTPHTYLLHGAESLLRS
jgi:hypothetical protein